MASSRRQPIPSASLAAHDVTRPRWNGLPGMSHSRTGHWTGWARGCGGGGLSCLQLGCGGGGGRHHTARFALLRRRRAVHVAAAMSRRRAEAPPGSNWAASSTAHAKCSNVGHSNGIRWRVSEHSVSRANVSTPSSVAGASPTEGRCSPGLKTRATAKTSPPCPCPPAIFASSKPHKHQTVSAVALGHSRGKNTTAGKKDAAS